MEISDDDWKFVNIGIGGNDLVRSILNEYKVCPDKAVVRILSISCASFRQKNRTNAMLTLYVCS